MKQDDDFWIYVSFVQQCGLLLHFVEPEFIPNTGAFIDFG